MPAATDALANLTLTPHPQLSKRRKPTSAGRQCVAYGVGLQGGTPTKADIALADPEMMKIAMTMTFEV